LIAADGSGAGVKLTEGGANDDADAVWSPEGDEIAFRRCTVDNGECDLHVMNADGTADRALAAAPGVDQDPTWSPDGRSIAFKSNRADGSPPGEDHFWIVRTNGSDLRQIPDGEGVAMSAPAWGPR
jgi:TolB protein